MKTCRYCGSHNREGYFYCEECGQPLPETEEDETQSTKKLSGMLSNTGAQSSWGTARFDKKGLIVFHVHEYPTPLTFRPNDQLILGRADTQSLKQPDVDFSPFGGLEKGVSRVHAVIFRTDETLVLVDKGSANGTHLNGQRLIPEQPRILRDGDEIRLGKLITHIYFKM